MFNDSEVYLSKKNLAKISGIFLMEEYVVFDFKDGEKWIRKDLMYNSAVFSRDFSKHDRIDLKNKSISDFMDFFIFLQSGEVPSDLSRQKVVNNLLVEWKFQFHHMDSFLLRITENKFPIKFNKKSYDVNFNRFLIHSSVFKDQYYLNPSCDLIFEFCIDDESFIEFLDVVHGKKYVHEIHKYVEVYKICEFFGCSSLSNLFDFKAILLSDIKNGIDLPNSEKFISENLRDFIEKPEFVKLPLPTLIRLFQQNKVALPFSELKNFLNNYCSLSPNGFRVLINNISLDFLSKEDVNELNLLFVQNFREQNSITSYYIKKESELKNEIKISNDENTKIKEELEILKKSFEEMKNKREEFEGIVNGKWKSIKAPDFEGNIFEAAATGKLTSIVYLLANGTNVNEIYNNEDYYFDWGMKNSTPLHFSSLFGHLRVVEYLVNHKADVNAIGFDD